MIFGGNKKRHPTHGKIHAGFVGQKQLPALFKLSGGWTAKEHEARTNLTAGRCVPPIKKERQSNRKLK
jgi:hypothetical protein